MKFARRALTIFGGAVLLVALAGLLAPKAAHALVATLVQVTNTSANPVPTVAVDTRNVNVVNTPNVNVSNALTVGIDSSNNTITLARDPENPARQPYQTSIPINFSDGDWRSGTFESPVPSNKELVIEYVSAYINLPHGQKITEMRVLTGVGGQGVSYYFKHAAAGDIRFDRLFRQQQPDAAICRPGTL